MSKKHKKEDTNSSDIIDEGLGEDWYQERRQWSNSRRQEECNKIALRQAENSQDMISTTANYKAIKEPLELTRYSLILLEGALRRQTKAEHRDHQERLAQEAILKDKFMESGTDTMITAAGVAATTLFLASGWGIIGMVTASITVAVASNVADEILGSEGVNQKDLAKSGMGIGKDMMMNGSPPSSQFGKSTIPTLDTISGLVDLSGNFMKFQQDYNALTQYYRDNDRIYKASPRLQQMRENTNVIYEHMKDLLFAYEMIGKRHESASEDYDNKLLYAEILYQMMEDDGIENPQCSDATEGNLHKDKDFDWR